MSIPPVSGRPLLVAQNNVSGLRSTGGRPPPISRLSPDLLRSISLYLPLKDMFQFTRTNRFIQKEVNNPLFFNDLFSRDFGVDLRERFPPAAEDDLTGKRIYTLFNQRKGLRKLARSCSLADHIVTTVPSPRVCAADLLNGNIAISIGSRVGLCSTEEGMNIRLLQGVSLREAGVIVKVIRLSDLIFLTADSLGRLIFWSTGGVQLGNLDSESLFEDAPSKFDTAFQFSPATFF